MLYGSGSWQWCDLGVSNVTMPHVQPWKITMSQSDSIINMNLYITRVGWSLGVPTLSQVIHHGCFPGSPGLRIELDDSHGSTSRVFLGVARSASNMCFVVEWLMGMLNGWKNRVRRFFDMSQYVTILQLIYVIMTNPGLKPDNFGKLFVESQVSRRLGRPRFPGQTLSWNGVAKVTSGNTCFCGWLVMAHSHLNPYYAHVFCFGMMVKKNWSNHVLTCCRKGSRGFSVA